MSCLLLVGRRFLLRETGEHNFCKKMILERTSKRADVQIKGWEAFCFIG